MEKDITSLTPEQLAVISQAATILQALSVHDTIETGDILAQYWLLLGLVGCSGAICAASAWLTRKPDYSSWD